MAKKLSEKQKVIANASDTLTDKPVTITINVKPENLIEKILMKLRLKASKHVFSITGASLGTMVRVSKLLLSLDYEERPVNDNYVLPWAYKAIVTNADIAVKIIATAIHNKKSEHPESLEDLIYENYDSKEFHKTALNIVNKLDVFTFMNTITLIRPITIMEEVSPGPAKIIEPEEITNGEQLETLSNIFASATKA